jgi:hypothetical protein
MGLAGDAWQAFSGTCALGKREWTVEASDFDAETTLTAYAYCEKKKK